MRIAKALGILSLIVSWTAVFGQDSKALLSIKKKLESAKAAEKLAGLKEAGELGDDGINLLPDICKILIGNNSKLAAQAAITIEKIDKPIYQIVIGLNKQNPALARLRSIQALSELDEKQVILLKPIIAWLIPQVPTKPEAFNLSELPIGEFSNRIDYMIQILENAKMDKELKTFIQNSTSINHPKIRKRVIQYLRSQYPTATPGEKKSYLSLLSQSLDSEDKSIRILALESFLAVKDDAKPYLEKIRKIAGFDPDESIRASAAEIVKAIDK